MYIYSEESNKDRCFMCVKPFKHYKVFKLCVIDTLKEVDLVVYCARCRNAIKQHKEIIDKLNDIKQERADREWQIFLNEEIV